MVQPVSGARLDELTDADLAGLFDPGTLGRGMDYARAGRVLEVALSPDGTELNGEVMGAGRFPYTAGAALRHLPLWQGQRVLSSVDSWCSCPMVTHCKHVVALLVQARSEPGRRAGASGGRQWEVVLGDLLDAEPQAPSRPETAVGIFLERPPRLPGRARWAAPGPAPERLVLRPVVPGVSGRWIRSGASWDTFAGGFDVSRGLRFSASAMDALTAIADAHRRASRLHGYGSLPDAIPLDQLGPHWWRLLRDAAAAGVTYLTDLHGGGGVHFVTEPARLVVEFARSAGGARLQPLLELPPPVGDGDASPPHLLGVPATGWWRELASTAHASPPLYEFGVLAEPLDQAQRRLLDGGPLTIPDADWPRFVLSALPGLRRRTEVRSIDPDLPLPEAVPPVLALEVSFSDGHACTLDWTFRYGGQDAPVHVPVLDPGRDPMRDHAAEADLLSTLHAAVPWPQLWNGAGGVLRLVAQQQLTGFATVALTQWLPVIEALEDVDVTVHGEPAAYIEVDEAPLIRVSTHDSDAGGDWFDLGVEVTVAGENVPLAALIEHLARDEERMLLDSGAWFALDRPELDALRRLLEEARTLQDKPSDPLRLRVVHAGLWEELVALGVVERQSARWQRRVAALLDLGNAPMPDVPAGLLATLRPYQVDGFQWLSLLWDAELGGILADDMGLGKTLQMLALAMRAHERGELADPMLIVAPTSVLNTWQREAARFAPGLSTVVLGETRRKAKVPLDAAIAGAHLVVTSYAVARLDEDALLARDWSAVVLDEAQFVKNHQSKTYQVVRKLPARRRFAITGTPLENSLMDLWSLLSVVAPGMYPRPAEFRVQWAKPIEGGEAPELLATLRRRIRPFLLRRTKEAVAPELPPKQEQVLAIDLHPRHRTIYDRHLQRERQRILGLIDDLRANRIAILRSLTMLRQLALDPALVDADYAGVAESAKIDTLVEHLVELAAEGHRALVFSQFTGFLALVRARLAAEGIAYSYLDGSTRDRQDRIEGFREGKQPVFLISLKAGGFGLTLTEADYVFVLDPWWNPAAENQAIDRTHRIGQTRPVNVYRLVSAGTIEEKVVALQDRKRDLFARVVDDGAMLSSTLTADDIRGLLEG